jgi:radical SAM-linked protein
VPCPTKIRIRFTKQADLRWISHRDLARLWERLLRRAGLELVFSQGFHPKPKISFPSALTLGIEAWDEVVELDLVGQPDLTVVQGIIEREMPAGMRLVSLQAVNEKARMLGAVYKIVIPAELIEPTRARIGQLLNSEVIQVVREGITIECSCQHPYFDLRLDGNTLHFSLPAAQEVASLRPSELLEQLYLDSLLTSGSLLVRTQVLLDDQTRPPKQPQSSESEFAPAP